MTMSVSQTWTSIAIRSWRWLRHPLVLLGVVLIALLVVAAGLFLPQLPGQLRAEPVSASRWIQETASGYGIIGALGLGLGLFDAFRSPLLFAALAALALLSAAFLADELAAVRQVRQVQQAATRSTLLPLTIQAPPTVYRRQATIPQARAAAQARLRELFRVTPGAIIRHTAGEQLSPAESAPSSPPVLHQTIAIHHVRHALLRPLLPAGLLMTIAALWVTFAAGEQVISPLLAPGDRFRLGEPPVLIQYLPPAAHDATAPPPMRLALATVDGTQALTVTRPMALVRDSVELRVHPEALALWIAGADDNTQLMRPGHDDTVRNALGLVVDAQNGEETVLLPQHSAGLRILPAAPPNRGFLVELYRSDRADPVWRESVAPGAPQTLQVDPQTAVRLAAVPALRVTGHSTPGRALAWLGLAVSLIGLAARLRAPFYIVVHLEPWSSTTDRVVVQSNAAGRAADIIAALQASLPTN